MEDFLTFTINTKGMNSCYTAYGGRASLLTILALEE